MELVREITRLLEQRETAVKAKNDPSQSGAISN
jgi:hypothetical protein